MLLEPGTAFRTEEVLCPVCLEGCVTLLRLRLSEMTFHFDLKTACTRGDADIRVAGVLTHRL